MFSNKSVFLVYWRFRRDIRLINKFKNLLKKGWVCSVIKYMKLNRKSLLIFFKLQHFPNALQKLKLNSCHELKFALSIFFNMKE